MVTTSGPAGDPGIERSLLSACRRAFPTLTDLRIDDLTRISDGWECEVYSFVLTGAESGEPRRSDLILRVYPDAGGEAKAGGEHDVVRRLHRAGFAVPAMLALGREDGPAGRPFVVMERIVGPVLGSRLSAATDGRREELLDRFCRLLAGLHALDWRPHVAEPGRYSADGHVARWVDWADGMLRRFGRSEFDPAVAWLRRRAADVRCERLSVTHGDYHCWNVLLRERDDALFVIDWTQAGISDYRFDLGWTLVLMRTNFGREMRDATLAGYERASGRAVPDPDFFEAAAALRRAASIAIALTAGPESLGMRPEAAGKMRDPAGHLATALAVLREPTGVTLPDAVALIEIVGDANAPGHERSSEHR